MTLYLWLISQTVNNDWDTYASAVVCAASEEEARLMHPDGSSKWDDVESHWDYGRYSWADPSNIAVRMIGITDKGVEPGVICSDFNAG
jgi:hypothetical protein